MRGTLTMARASNEKEAAWTNAIPPRVMLANGRGAPKSRAPRRNVSIQLSLRTMPIVGLRRPFGRSI